MQKNFLWNKSHKVNAEPCNESRSVLARVTLQKTFRPLARGIIQHIMRRAVFNYDALVHEENRVGDLAREFHLVGYNDHGGVFLREAANHL